MLLCLLYRTMCAQHRRLLVPLARRSRNSTRLVHDAQVSQWTRSDMYAGTVYRDRYRNVTNS